MAHGAFERPVRCGDYGAILELVFAKPFAIKDAWRLAASVYLAVELYIRSDEAKVVRRGMEWSE